MKFDKGFLICGLLFGVAGLVLGIYMAASQNHAQFVTHAHTLLIGFVLSLIYAVIHRLWLDRPQRTIATVQFLLHQTAAVVVSVGLFLAFGGYFPIGRLEPILGAASIGVLVALLLMLYMVLRSGGEGVST